MRVVTCGGGAGWEATLVRGLQRRELGVEVLRRCVDHGELVGIALRERPRAAIVSAELPWLDRELVGTLHDAGVTVIAVESVPGMRPLERMGVTHRFDPSAGAESVVALLARLAPERGPVHRGGAVNGGAANGGAANGMSNGAANPGYAQGGHGPSGSSGPPTTGAGGSGQGALVAVWGGAGSPGRTSVAVHVAVELAAQGTRVALIDGDCWAASMAQLLGIAESPSVTKAARLASDGWPESLATCLQDGPSGVRVLAGLPRADLWPEVRERAWRGVLDEARAQADTVVIDLAASIEEDEELSFDRVPYRRNLMTRVALEEADQIVFVVDANPIGVRRAIFAHRGLVEGLPRSVERIVTLLNRAPTGAKLRGQLGDELARWCELKPSVFLPVEAAFGRSCWEGRPLHDIAPKSKWLRDLRDLVASAGALAGAPAGIPAGSAGSAATAGSAESTGVGFRV